MDKKVLLESDLFHKGTLFSKKLNLVYNKTKS